MSSQRIVVLAGALLVAALAAWLLLSRPHVPAPADKASGQTSADRSPSTSGRSVATPFAAPAIAAAVAAPSSQSPVTPGLSSSPSIPPVQQAAPPSAFDPTAARSDSASINAIKVRRMVTDYHTLNGENPVGTNAEIMAAIMGKNARQAVLGPPEGVNLNARGELVDEWGTPYFFHQLSKDVMEIHSAGPDKVMGTADDIVVR